MVNFFETFSTPYFNNPKQDPIVESQEKKIKKKFMQFSLEVVILECYFQNHNQGILGINQHFWTKKQ